MYRPMLIILGIGIVAGAAIGFLTYSFSPFTAGAGIKFLFLASVCIVIISFSVMILYAVAVAWHEGGQYFMARYFGDELPYFKSAFRRAILAGILGLVLFTLRRYGLFTKYFAGAAAAIILILELLSSVHEKQVKIVSKL